MHCGEWQCHPPVKLVSNPSDCSKVSLLSIESQNDLLASHNTLKVAEKEFQQSIISYDVNLCGCYGNSVPITWDLRMKTLLENQWIFSLISNKYVNSSGGKCLILLNCPKFYSLKFIFCFCSIVRERVWIMVSREVEKGVGEGEWQ